METLQKAMIIDGIAATEGRDSQGEILKLAGCDVSQMGGRGSVVNDNHATGFWNTLGRIVEGKKIFSESDCENERHRMFLRQAGKPYLYVKAHLFDQEDHPNAKAVASIMRAFEREGTPIGVQFSVEGKVIRRDPLDHSILAQSMVRNVAMTLVPANKETAAVIAGDTSSVRKTVLGTGVSEAFAESMIKSLSASHQPRHKWDLQTDEERAEALLKRLSDIREEIRKGKSLKANKKKAPADTREFVDGKPDPRQLEFQFMKDKKVAKMMSPGYGGTGAPGQLTGGAALVSKQAAKQKALKEILKSVLGANPGVSLVKAMELVLKSFRDRFEKDEGLAPMTTSTSGAAASTATPAPAAAPAPKPASGGVMSSISSALSGNATSSNSSGSSTMGY
jgi:hypothetical protein